MALSRFFKFIKILIFALILIFYAMLLVHKITLPIDDLGRHIKNGELVWHGNFDVLKINFYSYTEPGFSTINHHWLSGVIFYLLHQAVGFGGLVIFKVIILLTAFAFLFLTALKKANFWLVVFFSLPTILILRERTNVRPEMFSYLFIAIFLYLLTNFEERPEGKTIFWLIPLQLLWANMHIYFFIGIALVAGFLLEKIVLGYRGLKSNFIIQKLFLVLIALVGVCLINPNGIDGATAPLKIVGNFADFIGENQTLFHFLKTSNPRWDVSIRLFRPLIFVLALSFLFNFRKNPLFYFLASAGVIAAGLFALRNLALFGLIFLPAVTANFSGVLERTQPWLKKNKLEKVWLLGFIVITFFLLFFYVPVVFLNLKYQQPGIGLTPESNKAALFFKEQNLHGPIFNDLDIGSYLVYHLFPEEKVFIDNRSEAAPADNHDLAYSSSFFNGTYLPTLTQEEKWQEMLEKYHFNTIFFYGRNPSWQANTFLRKRFNDPSWSLVYADTYALIFLRNVPENQDIIKKFQITKENVSERIDYLVKSSKMDDMVQAGNIFYLIGRESLAMSVLTKVVTKWPENSWIWFVMGAIESGKNDKENLNLAVTFLEKAIRLGEKTAQTYSFLGLAYFKSGQFQKANQTLQKALKIDPSRKDAKDYLSQLQKYLEQNKIK